nr:hypothetical protein Iba_chr12cCG24590 [Ipomoea batatas]
MGQSRKRSIDWSTGWSFEGAKLWLHVEAFQHQVVRVSKEFGPVSFLIHWELPTRNRFLSREVEKCMRYAAVGCRCVTAHEFKVLMGLIAVLGTVGCREIFRCGLKPHGNTEGGQPFIVEDLSRDVSPLHSALGMIIFGEDPCLSHSLDNESLISGLRSLEMIAAEATYWNRYGKVGVFACGFGGVMGLLGYIVHRKGVVLREVNDI